MSLAARLDRTFGSLRMPGMMVPTSGLLRMKRRAISGMVMGLMLEHAMGDETLAAHWEELPDVVVNLIVNGLRSSS